MENSENLIIDSKEYIIGYIYIIKNTITSKTYIGQTLSHRKNHNRYRPYGYIGRFKDHISEALCNTKKNQCVYLNSSIRKYGKENFIVELIEKCPTNLLNDKEIYYINKFNTLYPNGYNLTIGGKNMPVKHSITTTIDYVTKTYNYNHSNDTKEKIGVGIKNYYNSKPYEKINLMKRSQEQHYNNKIKIGINYDIDENNIDKYISIRKNMITVIFERKRDGKKVNFVIGKYESINDTMIRVKKYLNDIIHEKQIMRHHQIAGSP